MLGSLPQRNWKVDRVCPTRCARVEELPTRCHWYFTEIRFKKPFLVGSQKEMKYKWASSLCLCPSRRHSCATACDASHSSGHPVLTQGTEPSWACVCWFIPPTSFRLENRAVLYAEVLKSLWMGTGMLLGLAPCTHIWTKASLLVKVFQQCSIHKDC